jgi:hypothetical protein
MVDEVGDLLCDIAKTPSTHRTPDGVGNDDRGVELKVVRIVVIVRNLKPVVNGCPRRHRLRQEHPTNAGG